MLNRMEFCSLLIAAAVALPSVAAELSSEERDALLKELEGSRDALRAAVQGLSAAQWDYKPAADRWSIADCVEHLALTEVALRNLVQKQVLAAAPTPEKAEARKPQDAKVLATITDRSFKANAPETLVPTRRYATGEEAMKRFEQNRADTLAFAKDAKGLRDHSMMSPFRMDLDAYQWTLYLSGHTRRHTAQILEVKAGAGYPK